MDLSRSQNSIPGFIYMLNGSSLFSLFFFLYLMLRQFSGNFKSNNVFFIQWKLLSNAYTLIGVCFGVSGQYYYKQWVQLCQAALRSWPSVTSACARHLTYCWIPSCVSGWIVAHSEMCAKHIDTYLWLLSCFSSMGCGHGGSFFFFIIFNRFFLTIFIYSLLGRETDILYHWLTPQMGLVAGMVPEARSIFCFSPVISVAHTSRRLCCFPRPLAGHWSGSGAFRAWIAVLRDASVTGASLTSCTPMLSSRGNFGNIALTLKS